MIISLPITGLKIYSSLIRPKVGLLSDYLLFTGGCERVLDGDTISLSDLNQLTSKQLGDGKYSILSTFALGTEPETVRYAGFNSPDPGRADPDDVETIVKANDATQYNKTHTFKKQVVLICKKGEMYDIYDRILGYVFAPEQIAKDRRYFSMSHRMLEMGLGDTRYGSPDKRIPRNIQFDQYSTRKI